MNTFIENSDNSWQIVEKRSFTEEEINTVRSNYVIENDRCQTLCFILKHGGEARIPLLCKQEYIKPGNRINMREAKVVKLRRKTYSSYELVYRIDF